MIVGGGPAGISTWLHLNKYAPELAAKTVLIEKATYPRDKLCGGGVGAWSGFVLKHLGVDLNIPTLMISDIEFRYGKETYTLHQPNSFQMVRRIEFDHALAKTAIKRGLKLNENEMFLDVAQKNNLLSIKTNKRKYQIKVLIGGDGSLSIVRKKMKISTQHHLAPTIEVFAPANSQYDTEFDEKKILLDLTPQKEGLQGYVWHTPCIKNGVATIGHGLADFRMYPDKPRVDLKKIFIQVLQNRHIPIDRKSWSSLPIRWYSPEELISQPNIILVGDAAGIEPAFGGGIHFALSYGEIATNSIIDAMQQNNFSFNDYNQRVQSHLVGKFIAKCTRLARGMYNQTLNPLDVAREVFTIKK
jgi:flavin-dependent dehydrogenase